MTIRMDENSAPSTHAGSHARWAALLSPPHLKSLPAWTPWQDTLALSDRAQRARMRFLFTPLRAPALSAAGARAGLGPDGAARERPQADGVDTRQDPRLDRGIASRLPDDISEAAQMAQAERMGVHVPVEAPTLSAAGAMAGLGALGPSSSSPKAVALASARELTTSVSKVRMGAQKATAMQSTPVRAISDASGRAGITGKGVIRAAGAGFEMQVPKGPVAQDRERWKSGTTDRIAAASKGLSLANMDWGDHRGTPPKPQAKRTWVGKQGDATECPDDCKEACADLAVAPHSAVNKGAPYRELEKERVVSDVCPPIRSTLSPLEVLLRDDERLLARSPEELLMKWRTRLPLTRLASRLGATGPSASAPLPVAGLAQNGPSTKTDCGCSDCGCKNDSLSSSSGAIRAQKTATEPRGSSHETGSPVELAALIESFALRHGKDGNSEWFAPIFLRKRGRLAFGSEQRGPSSHAWQPNPDLGRKPGDELVATIHTHSRSSSFSEDDRAAAAALGVPMLLVAAGAERVRIYDPATRAIGQIPVGGSASLRGKALARTWASIAKRTGRSSKRRNAARITISQPAQRSGVNVSPTGLYQPMTIAKLPPPLIDLGVLRRVVQLAVDSVTALRPMIGSSAVDVGAELIWLVVADEAAKGKLRVTVIPDPDLFRAIVGVAKRLGPTFGYADQNYLDLAQQEPPYVDPLLLDLIIKFAQQSPALEPPDVWTFAWNERLRTDGVPTPPDLPMFQALRVIAQELRGAKAAVIQSQAQDLIRNQYQSVGAPIWPRYIANDLLTWLCFSVAFFPSDPDGYHLARALFMVAVAGGKSPPNPHPEPMPDGDLLPWLVVEARANIGRDPMEVRNLALADRLFGQLLAVYPRPAPTGPGFIPGLAPGPGGIIPGGIIVTPIFPPYHPPPAPRTSCDGCTVTSTIIDEPPLSLSLLGEVDDKCVTILGTLLSKALNKGLDELGLPLDVDFPVPVHFETTTCNCPDGPFTTTSNMVFGCPWLLDCLGPKLNEPCDPFGIPPEGKLQADCCEGICVEEFNPQADPMDPYPYNGVCRSSAVGGSQLLPGSGQQPPAPPAPTPPPFVPSCAYEGEHCASVSPVCCGGNTCSSIDGLCHGGAARPPLNPCPQGNC